MAEPEQSDQAVDQVEVRRQRFKLSHPAVSMRLIRELALTNKTQRQLAEEYGVVQSSICAFSERNADAINDVRENAEDEFAGLWVAKKQNRVAAYKEQIDYIADRIGEGLEDDPVAALKVAQAALKAVAEEMGQLTARVAVQADVQAKVRYEIVGVNPEDLT